MKKIATYVVVGVFAIVIGFCALVSLGTSFMYLLGLMG